MKKPFALAIIILLVSVSAVTAQQEIGGYTELTPTPPPSAPVPGAPTLAPSPTGPQPNAYLYRGPGINYKVYDQPLLPDKIPAGFSYAGAYPLTNANVGLIRENKPLVAIDHYKVVLRNSEGTLDVSIGIETIRSWSGPDKFSYDPATKQYFFDNNPISPIPDSSGNLRFRVPGTAQEISGAYINPLENGGLQELRDGKVTVYDAQGKIAGSFSEADWTKTWKRYFTNEKQFAQLAYTISDFDLDPEDVTPVPSGAGTGFYTNSIVISTTNGKFEVTRGTIADGKPTGAFTRENYRIVDGQKIVDQIIERDAKGNAYEALFEDNHWTIVRWNTQTQQTEKIDFSIETYAEKQVLVLGTVGAVHVVQDPNTGKIKYYKPDKLTEFTSAELQELGKNENTKKSLKDTAERGDSTNEARERRRLAELPETMRFQCTRAGAFNLGQCLGTFVKYYADVAGFAGWSALIWDEKFLQKWRDKVNTIMCDKLHLPTKECWTSKICGRYSDITPTRDGVLYSTPAGGAPRALAHIEGQRSLPMVTPAGTSWGYTVTFNLNNPTEKTMKYNVRFIGPRREPLWWSELQGVGAGGSVSALGTSALYKISANDYNHICLEFNPSITSFGGKRVSKVCNDVVQYSGEATAPYPPPPTAEEVTTPDAPTPAAPGAPQPPGASI